VRLRDQAVAKRMHAFEVIIALLLAGAGLTALSRRIGTPYPAMVALAGASLALVPGTSTLVLDPELALALFVAPVLLDAGFDASLRDLRVNWRSVVGLAIGAVTFTVVVVAVVARALVPEMPWPVAVALGAIVAPPDAAAATAVLRQLRPPHRLLVILEGESLFNDASALVIYRGRSLRPQPPRVHSRRVPAQGDPRPDRRAHRCALCRDCKRGVRRDDRRAHRLGIGDRRLQPMDVSSSRRSRRAALRHSRRGPPWSSRGAACAES
jgi:hypothetical protein